MVCGFYSVGLTTETKNKKDIGKRVCCLKGEESGL